jgi:uncharacterized repeat protein (TIGR03803 family)
MKKRDCWQLACAAFALCSAAVTASFAQTFSVLANFDGENGSHSAARLVQGIDGDFYGTTDFGGSGCGTVFKVTSAGRLTTLATFPVDCVDTISGLAQDTQGSFYGTTHYGGLNYAGTIFKITPDGPPKQLYSFCHYVPQCTDGEYPGALVQGSDGGFYGTTFGGDAYGWPNLGSIYKITPSGQLMTVYSFTDQSGSFYPNYGLVEGTDGNFYGTTFYAWGQHGLAAGAIFQVTPGGTLTNLHFFCPDGPPCPDSPGPSALVQDRHSDFLYGAGVTVYKIAPDGRFATLHRFSLTGAGRAQGLVQASDGNFYGTTSGTAAPEHTGTIFRITPDGTLTTLHRFALSDGWCPAAGVVEGTDGNLYGTTYYGGATGYPYGTVYRLSVGLPPFVKLLPPAGRVGDAVKLLGTNLTGTTSVTFNGTPAAFTVIRPSAISTTVPSGATTGEVQVTGPYGTLESKSDFHVLQ